MLLYRFKTEIDILCSITKFLKNIYIIWFYNINIYLHTYILYYIDFQYKCIFILFLNFLYHYSKYTKLYSFLIFGLYELIRFIAANKQALTFRPTATCLGLALKARDTYVNLHEIHFSRVVMRLKSLASALFFASVCLPASAQNTGLAQIAGRWVFERTGDVVDFSRTPFGWEGLLHWAGQASFTPDGTGGANMRVEGASVRCYYNINFLAGNPPRMTWRHVKTDYDKGECISGGTWSRASL